MIINKSNIVQVIITTAITVIVSTVGLTLFNAYVAIYSGITSGLSVTVGKEYADSLTPKDHWNFRDLLANCIGVLVGILITMTLYYIS